MNQIPLPLFKKVVFVDWHGVASSDPFFITILQNKRHPLHGKLKYKISNLFRNNDRFIQDWMRNQHDVKTAIDMIKIPLGRRFNDDYLERKIFNDCKFMKPNIKLFDILWRVQDLAYIVVATDNMEFFLKHFRQLRHSQRKMRINIAENAIMNNKNICEAIMVFDDILCSSEVGVLKRENIIKFFGYWLALHSLEISNALLIDDIDENCNAFINAGGNAIKLSMKKKDMDYDKFEKELLAWLQSPA